MVCYTHNGYRQILQIMVPTSLSAWDPMIKRLDYLKKTKHLFHSIEGWEIQDQGIYLVSG